LYYEQKDGRWMQMSLHGLVEPDPAAPVTHVSYYEADAFARWAGKRLPSEFEWEVAAAKAMDDDIPNDAASEAFRPRAISTSGKGRLSQMLGDVWEWTSSAYLPYPGFRAAPGAVGEYNGKFMVNQHVLRGGSCATARGHSRITYRNFFYPHQRWQFTGLRLADDGT
jgi:ergothioneine biosynthesis protein EgtB